MALRLWCQPLQLGAAQELEGLRGGQLPWQLHSRRSELQGCLHMEAAAQALDVGRAAGAQEHLTAAEQCLGVSSEVTGKAGPQSSLSLSHGQP